ncbi:MAG: lactonase family protein [Planctomycetaceae bacterium]
MRTTRCWLCMLVSFTLLAMLMGVLSAADEPREIARPDEAAEREWMTAYIGTYTRGSDSQGIYRFRVDPVSGEMTEPELAGEVVNPSFLAIHPHGKFLYAVSEIEDLDGRPTGGVVAFSIGAANGELTRLNAQPSGGGSPCHINVDSWGGHVYVANYGGGSVAMLPIAEDGSLKPASAVVQHAGKSVDPRRQEAPHAHSITLSPDEKRAYVADLGLDQVLVYDIDHKEGTLTPAEPPHASVAPGAGPRHFDFHPNGELAYVINELSQTVTAFEFDAESGRLQEVQTISTLPGAPVPGNSTADIHVHPNGKALYGSNRGHNSIVVYAIDADRGTLKLVQHQSTLGEVPRNFAIVPGGNVLLAENQESGTIASFTIDPETGLLNATRQMVKVPKPVCIRFMPATSH